MATPNQLLYTDAANSAADANGIPRQIFDALIQHASQWNPYQTSSTGAVGLTGLAPSMSSVNAWDPAANLQGGAAYLKGLFTQYGNWSDALAHYNYEPGMSGADTSFASSVLGTATQLGYVPAVSSPATGAAVPPSITNVPDMGSVSGGSWLPSMTDIIAGVQSSIVYIVAIFLLLVVGYFAVKALFENALAPTPQKALT